MGKKIEYSEHDLKYAFICGWLSARTESILKMSKPMPWKHEAAKLMISLPIISLWRYIKPKYFEVYLKPVMEKFHKDLDNHL